MDMDLWHRALGGFGGEPFPFVEVDFPDRARPVTFWTAGAGFGSHPPYWSGGRKPYDTTRPCAENGGPVSSAVFTRSFPILGQNLGR